ncbi:tetratricopeptide repeat protein [Kutzneria sp. 744]|uniref:ATP-binding protein n=1 Tax=Kutzneria sp. (strain 744) TaxID=345341 RepID=UPI0004BB6780|nr:tetratricopeptide repeat protein [Kutzneria sp. 744]
MTDTNRHTSNTVNTNTVNGLIVQGGLVTGDIHQHLPAPRPPTPPPCQLLSAPAGFVGRDDKLAALDACTTAVISAIGGAGGIGKTWLALTWANRNLGRFPDGQLSADLRGFGPAAPRHPADVLADFLAALGVDRDHQPTDLDARIALYRTHTAGRRLLILLDNAATADQVEPLLPGGTTCTVLITSRHRLPSLLARHGAHPVHVDVLTDAEARTLLEAALGHSAERAVTELIALCKGFPLALGLIAARIRSEPTLIDDLVADLGALGLAALDSDDPAASLPTVLSWSLRRLTEQHRTVFGLLGIAPGPDIALPAVVSLTWLSHSLARQALSALEEASLLERRPGGRYVMHDLIRDYAASTVLSEDVREAALVRVTDFYLHTAFAADRLLESHTTFVPPDPPAAGVHPFPLPDFAAALHWMEAEHAALLATQRAALAIGRHHVVPHLAWILSTFHHMRGNFRDAFTAWQAALDAAAHLPDPSIRGRAHRNLGRACTHLGRHEEAIEHLDQALGVAADHHDATQQAFTHQALALAWAGRGNDRRALEHARHALDLCRDLELPLWEATSLNMMGWYSARLGEFGAARDLCLAALDLYRRHDHPGGKADTLDSLGYIAHHSGDHRQALDHYHQALLVRRPTGDAYEVANTLDSIGRPYAASGQQGRARAVWLEALDLYRQQGRTADAERVQRQLDELRPP